MPEIRIRLTDDPHAVTRLHLFEDAVDTEVWLDTEEGERDGLLLGMGRTRAEAVEEAKTELLSRLYELERVKR